MLNVSHKNCPFCPSSDAFSYSPETGMFKCFLYNPTTGVIFDLRFGREAGWHKHDGYRQISYGNKKYYSHRVAFFLMEGRWPYQIDHINRDRSDNRWENLREVTNKQQSVNKSGWGSSGLKGVWWCRTNNKWVSQVRYNGKVYHVGCFDDPLEAKEARDQKARLVHGEYFSD